MESELAKTLRSMSDDHRMVPDFSEKLLDIADAIERQAKEIGEFNTEANRLVAINRALINERDAALAEVERLKADIADANLEKRYQWGML